jgi:hypothetical protein
MLVELYQSLGALDFLEEIRLFGVDMVLKVLEAMLIF